MKEPIFCEDCGGRLSNSYAENHYDTQTGQFIQGGDRSLMCSGGWITPGCLTQYFLCDGEWIKV
jgi:hypothetical protein